MGDLINAPFHCFEQATNGGAFQRSGTGGRLQTVGFFLKISKVIGKAWRKSLTRARREKNIFLASLPSLTLRFQPRSRPFV